VASAFSTEGRRCKNKGCASIPVAVGISVTFPTNHIRGDAPLRVLIGLGPVARGLDPHSVAPKDSEISFLTDLAGEERLLCRRGRDERKPTTRTHAALRYAFSILWPLQPIHNTENPFPRALDIITTDRPWDVESALPSIHPSIQSPSRRCLYDHGRKARPRVIGPLV
jgi:hypothetical protein